MGVSQSGYYTWRHRLSKPPCLKRKRLENLIAHCYWENRRRYGTRRICAALTKYGIKVGRCAVRRVMGEQNLKAIAPQSFVPRTTDSKEQRLRRIYWRASKHKNVRQRKSLLGILHICRCRIEDGVIWRYGRIRSPDESSAGVWRTR